MNENFGQPFTRKEMDEMLLRVFQEHAGTLAPHLPPPPPQQGIGGLLNPYDPERARYEHFNSRVAATYENGVADE